MGDAHSTPVFNIGITMAGAGSAGCYTAGVMDYLFEILDLWEKAKQKDLPGFEEYYDVIPQHRVLIDAMGGTSAGGMTTMMSAIYALGGNINPVTDPLFAPGKKNNILYDSWVGLDDDVPNGRTTLAKAWDADDLKDNKFCSLLNTKIIDDIADHVFEVTGSLEKSLENLPAYFSKDLDIILAHTMLRGIPLAINFSTPIGEVKAVNDLPAHNSFDHFTVSHYKLNKGKPPQVIPGEGKSNFLWFNPYDEKAVNIMKLTTKSTGAFPIGLRFREIDQNTFTDDYLKCMAEYIVFNRLGEEQKHQIDWSKFPSPFNFVTIDGGAINNEPFGEVLGILKSRYGACIENGYPKYGVVMIDPFPDDVDTVTPYKAPEDLFDVVPAIISTLHEQSKVKRGDIVEAAEHPYFRGEIFPRRWDDKIKDINPITSSSASAFGGFLSLDFRHYDFFLGRDNARNYYRYYFSFEYRPHPDPAKNIVHPIHKVWTNEMIALFTITGKDGKTYLPIIPDLNILRERKLFGEQRSPFEYSVTVKPKYNPVSLFNLREQMEDRFERIIEIAKSKAMKKSAAVEGTETDSWMDKYYHKSLWDRFKGWIISTGFRIIFRATKSGIARMITEIAVKWVLTDLDKKGMLEKNK